ncbi:hypothetical protein M378DRAFT_17184 [Amanita muscaria Koide BX008]|uniref:Uncharacterized protein n=1 Tax=Amanita muscaria (strain Koide BX008) TaxID=946122 RepID=A0A0C2WJJ4_AMAMK|nr:hypothetical protein M378DRAFT_17184 [Amanita muscaria Koide BX008]
MTGKAKALRKEARKGKGKAKVVAKDEADEEGGSDSESSGSDGTEEELPLRRPKQSAGDQKVTFDTCLLQIELVDLHSAQQDEQALGVSG